MNARQTAALESVSYHSRTEQLIALLFPSTLALLGLSGLVVSESIIFPLVMIGAGAIWIGRVLTAFSATLKGGSLLVKTLILNRRFDLDEIQGVDTSSATNILGMRRQCLQVTIRGQNPIKFYEVSAPINSRRSALLDDLVTTIRESI